MNIKAGDWIRCDCKNGGDFGPGLCDGVFQVRGVGLHAYFIKNNDPYGINSILKKDAVLVTIRNTRLGKILYK